MRLTIDVDYLAERLQQFLAIPSPTGYTDTVVRACSHELKRLGLTVELTRRGAIRAIRPGRERRPARAIISHLDTLGAQVKRLQPNGRVALIPIGHWSARFAEGARATLFSESGAYRGTILPLKASGHTFNDAVDTAPVGWDHVELRLDVASADIPALERLGVDVGDIVAIDPQPEFLDNGYIVSRHLDDKAGAAVMLATLQALQRDGAETEVDTHWLFTVEEEVGVGAAAVVTPDVASIVSVDNGTTAPGQNSSEFGVTLCAADQTGPFDWHLLRKLKRLCREHDIRHQTDVFRYYRSDSAAAVVAGHDVRSALVTFGVDASHGYERIHMHALRSLAELLSVYVTSPIEIARDADEVAEGLAGFTRQPTAEAALESGEENEIAWAEEDGSDAALSAATSGRSGST